MSALRVLVIGGYGFFGRRLAQRLARDPGLEVIVAGRSLAQARSTAAEVSQAGGALFGAAALDTSAPMLASDLAKLEPDVVVLSSGPFQGAGYQVARACIAARAHYVDLSDGREFVAGIPMLDAEASAAGITVVSGASSVPALSSAAADRLARGFVSVQRIDIGISPGNRTERGLSTMQAVLGYCGRRLPDMDGLPTYGWSGTHRHAYPAPIGTRLLSPCDVPDLALLPARYAGAPSVRFGAGLELALLHRGMNVMAWLARRGVVRDWSRHAARLKRVADRLRGWGSDAGAMHVQVSGTSLDGRATTRCWHLVATDGDGPYVPTLAAAAWLQKLKNGSVQWRGAKACVGLLSLDDFAAQTDGLRIRMTEAAA